MDIRQAKAGAMEILESRRLLAGNVLVTAPATGNAVGNLTVTGDNKSNQVLIDGLNSGGYFVTGLNGTKINGSSATQFFPSLHKRVVVASLGNGDDYLKFINFAHGLHVTTGNGSDTVEVVGAVLTEFGLDVGGDLSIDTGNGSDNVLLQSTFVGGDTRVALGNGDDALSFVNTVTLVGGKLFNGGKGDDSLFGTLPIGSTMVAF